jgi:hypothetical protein
MSTYAMYKMQQRQTKVRLPIGGTASEMRVVQPAKNGSFFPLVSSDALTTKLSTLLTGITSRLNPEAGLVLTHGAAFASLNGHGQAWPSSDLIQFLKRELMPVEKNIATLLWEGSGKDDAVRLITRLAEAVLQDARSSGHKMIGYPANYSLETDVPIVDVRAILLKITSSLLLSMVAPERFPQIWSRRAANAISPKEIPALSIGVPRKHLPESGIISDTLVLFNHRARVYCNPPFGSIMHNGRKKGPTAWMRKAIEEQRKGKLSVVVYPVDKWVLMMLAATGAVNVRNLGDVRWLATEDGTIGKGTGRHIAAFILYPANAANQGSSEAR